MSEIQIVENDLSIIDVKGKYFNFIMKIYQTALEQVFQELVNIQKNNNLLISNVTKRIKNPKSIIKKMKKKNYEINYNNLIEHIEDIAGVRVVCPLKENIYSVINCIKELPNVKVLKEKDYLTKPKRSGYSAYHLIVETPINVLEEEVLVKVEIQIRTMAMDFWATNEHDVRYKTNRKISIIDSKKLYFYAKVINILDDKMMKISKKLRYKEVMN